MEGRQTGNDGSGSTRTVDRALDLLTAITDGGCGTTLSELARCASLSPATASRLLATLDRRGFVARDEHGAYGPGRRLRQVAAAVLHEEPLYELAGAHLAELARAAQETANLGVAVDDERAVYLRQVAGPQRVQTAAWTGRMIPRDGTAMGAALAGAVSRDGYAFTRGRIEPDVTAVAAPIRDRHGDVVAALTILAPSYRTTDADVERFGALLVDHAAELSLALGAPPA